MLSTQILPVTVISCYYPLITLVSSYLIQELFIICLYLNQIFSTFPENQHIWGEGSVFFLSTWVCFFCMLIFEHKALYSVWGRLFLRGQCPHKWPDGCLLHLELDCYGASLTEVPHSRFSATSGPCFQMLSSPELPRTPHVLSSPVTYFSGYWTLLLSTVKNKATWEKFGFFFSFSFKMFLCYEWRVTFCLKTQEAFFSRYKQKVVKTHEKRPPGGQR